MQLLDLKPAHKPVKQYYQLLEKYHALTVDHEGAVRAAFQSLLETCAGKFNWTLVNEWKIKRSNQRPISVDGALVDGFRLPHGYWEAKDVGDDLEREIPKKFAAGYPKDNILFQTPRRAVLYQDGKRVLDDDITRPEALVDALKTFFEYTPPQYAEWERAADEFKERVPELAGSLVELIERERKSNKRFVAAFSGFMELCRASINPNLSEAAVEEMLIQHLLTERIFSKVFDNADFARRNVIAHEIEKVIDALTSQSFSRNEFIGRLDRFYTAIEGTAATIDDFSQKQGFLNAVYERFFRGFSVKVADTHGIVYTPQPIVNFMVKSVEEILHKEFGKSLADKGVHILDPFVGTGNFIVRIMQEMPKTALPYKFKHELHCNEVMLLPYYIASMNIEHQYFEATGKYEPFEGICLVDTFELAEDHTIGLFTAENTARVERQKRTPIFVFIGNPPYNVGQINENDNNKNRKYETIDKRVAATYIRKSSATLNIAVKDPYVKAFRWASDRIIGAGEGVVAFVTNSGFIDGLAFDGMRKELAREFDTLYILDLGGNVRKNPKLSGTTHNVFGIQVGVSINILVRKRVRSSDAAIYYASIGAEWRKEQKYEFLEAAVSNLGIVWQELTPDARGTWLREGLKEEYDEFIPMGTKEKNAVAVFALYSNGIKTNRDAWAYNSDSDALHANMQRMIGVYNEHVDRFSKLTKKVDVDVFVDNDDRKISWSGDLKTALARGVSATYREDGVRNAAYRPFSKQYLYFDRLLNNSVYYFGNIFPTPLIELENRMICVTGSGSEKPFLTLATVMISDLHLSGSGCTTQCFPFYTYDKDGTNRRENITDWALAEFRAHYKDETITKWDIFHYVYAVLHHPEYRARYAANLKRDLPRVPYAPDFHAFARAGARLADLHVNYEHGPEYSLKAVETPDLPLDWRVEKMKLAKDKTQIQYNNFLTLAGIPPEAYEYRLGNRSALEWVIDQYRVSTDARSGITNDPNRADDPEYIVRLIRQVVAVSVETVAIVNALPELGVPETVEPVAD